MRHELGSQYPREKLGVMSQSRIRISGGGVLSQKQGRVCLRQATEANLWTPYSCPQVHMHLHICVHAPAWLCSYNAHTRRKCTVDSLEDDLPLSSISSPITPSVYCHCTSLLSGETANPPCQRPVPGTVFKMYNLMVFKVTYDSWSERNNNIKEWSGKELSLLLLAPFAPKQLRG